MHDITGTWILCTTEINHECLYWKSWNVTFQALHRVKKYPCDYGTNNYNPIWPGINSEIYHAAEGPCAYLKK